MRFRRWRAFSNALLKSGALAILVAGAWWLFAAATHAAMPGRMILIWSCFIAVLVVIVQAITEHRTRSARRRWLATPGREYGTCSKCGYPLRALPLKQRVVRGLWMYRRECPECGHASW